MFTNTKSQSKPFAFLFLLKIKKLSFFNSKFFKPISNHRMHKINKRFNSKFLNPNQIHQRDKSITTIGKMRSKNFFTILFWYRY